MLLPLLRKSRQKLKTFAGPPSFRGKAKRSRGVIIASSACAPRSSSRLARLSARRHQSALTGLITLGLVEIL